MSSSPHNDERPSRRNDPAPLDKRLLIAVCLLQTIAAVATAGRRDDPAPLDKRLLIALCVLQTIAAVATIIAALAHLLP